MTTYRLPQPKWLPQVNQAHTVDMTDEITINGSSKQEQQQPQYKNTSQQLTEDPNDSYEQIARM